MTGNILIDKISGFVSKSPNVVILYKGKPFYAKTNKGGGIHFNLPKGAYEVISGEISAAPLVKYPEIKISEGETTTKFPGAIEIVFIVNPNKCSVDLAKGLVMFDHSFKDVPKYKLMWIAGHELGHYKYRGNGEYSERACDTFSANWMLKNGYNPTQISAAIGTTLGDSYFSKCRKDYNFEKLKTVEKQM